MKKITMLFCVICTSTYAFSQYDSISPYLKNKAFPNFILLNTDSVEFTQTVLVEGKNTIIMLYNPECEHCQEQLQLLISLPEVILNTNILLTSTESLKKIQIFYNKFHLAKYPLIHVGKDYKYFFGSYFRPKTIPVLAFYNRQKQLVYFNQGNVKKKQILDAFKK
jgi:thiol-disulfide isomerase/thioredoxin